MSFYMAQTTINIRMDETTKVAFDKFCREIGLSTSTAFNIFAKTVVREQRIPFALTTEVPNAITLAAENGKKSRKGRAFARSFFSLEEASNAL